MIHVSKILKPSHTPLKSDNENVFSVYSTSKTEVHSSTQSPMATWDLVSSLKQLWYACWEIGLNSAKTM